MHNETYSEKHINELVYALQQARQSIRWLIRNYPNDSEISAHQAHLRRIEQALKGWE